MVGTNVGRAGNGHGEPDSQDILRLQLDLSSEVPGPPIPEPTTISISLQPQTRHTGQITVKARSWTPTTLMAGLKLTSKRVSMS